MPEGMNRPLDRVWITTTIGGALVIIGLFVLKLRGAIGDVTFGYLFGLGCAMLAPNIIVDVIRKRLAAGQSDPPEPPAPPQTQEKP